MIDIVMSGMCEGCEYSDLVLDVVSATNIDGGIPERKSWMIRCEHMMACLAMKKKMIGELPAVQPQQTCEYWDTESNFCALCRPSAQPERPKGKWIPKSESGCVIECSSCSERMTVLGDEHPNFCPYCGADMREE